MMRLSLLACFALAACAGKPASTPAAESSEGARWDALVHDTIEGKFAVDPGFAVYQGRHEFDGKVADVSPAAQAANVTRLKNARAAVAQFDTAQLDATRAFEREYVLAKLDGELFWAERRPQWQLNPLYYADLIDPVVYLTRNYAPLDKRMAAYSAQAREIPRVMAAMKQNLKTPLPRSFVEVGVQVFGGFASYLEADVPRIFASVQDAAAQAALSEAIGQAVAAVKDARGWLDAQRAQATEDYALGPDLFREMLWATERVDTPLELLEQIGRSDLERNLAALTAACAQFAAGKSLAECAALVNGDKPAEGPVQGARNQLESLRKFIVEQKLLTIPGPEQAEVQEAPPYKRWNQAYIEIPGPFEHDLPSVYYIAPPDPAWSEADRRAYIPGEADLLFITVHEVWPGHFLQYLHANRAERLFGRVFVGYAFAEGWAHYAEEMMWDAGLSTDPKLHVGQLLNALLRNVRYLSALGLHTHGMSVAESEKMFREQALQDPGNAKQQAARGTFDPAYLNYTLGKLMIRKLREDYVKTRGGRAAWGEFHDRFLSFGGPPLPLVRKSVLGDASNPL